MTKYKIYKRRLVQTLYTCKGQHMSISKTVSNDGNLGSTGSGEYSVPGNRHGKYSNKGRKRPSVLASCCNHADAVIFVRKNASKNAVVSNCVAFLGTRWTEGLPGLSGLIR